MKSKSANRPYERLIAAISGCNKAMIILCASSRAAALLKRKLLKSLPGNAILNIDILAPNELIAQLTREMGIEAQVIGGLGREMVLNEILNGMKKKAFKETEMRDYVRSIGKAVAELIQTGISESELRSSSCGSEKMGLLIETYSAYIARIGKSGAIDAKQLPDKVFEKIRRNGLPDFLKSKSIITYCIPPDILTDKLVTSLEAEGILVEGFDEEPVRKLGAGSMHCFYAREGRQLAREVARRCKMLAGGSDSVYQEICILVPPIPGAEREIVKALEWAGIASSDPLWMDLSEHPSASSLITAMRLFALSGEKVDVFPYCSSPYYGLDYFKRAADPSSKGRVIHVTGAASKILARQWRKSEPLYLKEWADERIWIRHFKSVKDDDSAMDSMMSLFYEWTRLIHEHAEALNRPNTWDGHCDNLEKFVKEFYVDKGALCDEEGDPGRAALEQKAILGILDVINKVRSAFSLIKRSGDKVGWAEFSSTMADAFKEKRLMLRGASRTGVGIAEAKDILGLQFKHLIVFDASERNFPTQWNPGWLLTERDRGSINAFKEQNAEARIAHSKAEFFTAVANAGESISFAIPSIGQDEKAINRSIWVADAEAEFSESGSKATNEFVKRRYPAPESLESSVTEVEALLHLADERFESVGGDGKSLEALYDANRGDEDRLAALAKAKFGDEYRWSASMIGQYLKCGLAFVPQYLAGIRQKDEYEELPSPMSTGKFLHNIAKMVVDEIGELLSIPYEQAWEELEQRIVKELSYDKAKLAENMTEELWGILRVPYERTIRKFAESELAYLQTKGSCFVERLTEQKFKTNDNAGRLHLQSIDISFEARIDRIDMDSEGNAAIYDYKSGSLPDREQDVQVDFYSLIVKQQRGLHPIASAYFPLHRSKGCTRAEINLGSYVDEFYQQLGFKPPRSNNHSLIHYPLAQAEDRFTDASIRIEGIVKNIIEGAFYRKSPSNFEPCKHCIRGNICWLYTNA